MFPFAYPEDVEAVWRSMTATEVTVATNLLQQASAKLRVRVPTVDTQIADDATGLKASLASAAVVNAVRRLMINPEAWLSESEAIDDYRKDRRRDSSVSAGLLYLDEGDLIGLLPKPSRKWSMVNLRATI